MHPSATHLDILPQQKTRPMWIRPNRHSGPEFTEWLTFQQLAFSISPSTVLPSLPTWPP